MARPKQVNNVKDILDSIGICDEKIERWFRDIINKDEYNVFKGVEHPKEYKIIAFENMLILRDAGYKPKAICEFFKGKYKGDLISIIKDKIKKSNTDSIKIIELNERLRDDINSHLHVNLIENSLDDILFKSSNIERSDLYKKIYLNSKIDELLKEDSFVELSEIAYDFIGKDVEKSDLIINKILRRDEDNWNAQFIKGLILLDQSKNKILESEKKKISASCQNSYATESVMMEMADNIEDDAVSIKHKAYKCLLFAYDNWVTTFSSSSVFCFENERWLAIYLFNYLVQLSSSYNTKMLGEISSASIKKIINSDITKNSKDIITYTLGKLKILEAAKVDGYKAIIKDEIENLINNKFKKLTNLSYGESETFNNFLKDLYNEKEIILVYKNIKLYNSILSDLGILKLEDKLLLKRNGEEFNNSDYIYIFNKILTILNLIRNTESNYFNKNVASLLYTNYEILLALINADKDGSRIAETFELLKGLSLFEGEPFKFFIERDVTDYIIVEEDCNNLFYSYSKINNGYLLFKNVDDNIVIEDTALYKSISSFLKVLENKKYDVPDYLYKLNDMKSSNREVVTAAGSKEYRLKYYNEG